MQTYEYKAVPAPNRPKRVKGVKGTAGRFAALLTETMNEQAKEGWEYMRSDSLPVEDKPGLLKSRVETYQTMLIFRRALVAEDAPVMAGYIEDQTEAVSTEDPAVDTAPEHELPDEPTVSSDWADSGRDNYPQDPPLTGGSDESPFAEPNDSEDQIIR